LWRISHDEHPGAAVKGQERLFTKNTGLCKGASQCIGADACPVPYG